MSRVPVYCAQCREPFQQAAEVWPKQCVACRHTEWGNPLPVTLALLPIHDQVILVKRNLEPGLGKWALPGGFVNHGESPEQTAARESVEETVREDLDGNVIYSGLSLAPSFFRHLHTHGDAAVNLTLMFYQAVGCERLIAEWCLGLAEQTESTERWNPEVQQIGLFSRREIVHLEIAFPTHEEVLSMWFDRPHAMHR